MVKSYLSNLQLVRLYNFGLVLFGFIVGSLPAINLVDLANVLLWFIPLWLGVYGGLYLLNDLADYESDLELKKENNPLVNKSLTQTQVLWFALTRILLGLVLTFNLDPIVFYWALAIIFTNLLYSFVLKKLSKTLATLVIATTGPLKVALGIYFANENPLLFFMVFLIHYLVSVSFHLIKSSYKNTANKNNTGIDLAWLGIIIILTVVAVYETNLKIKLVSGLVAVFGIIFSASYRYHQGFKNLYLDFQKKFF